jgi:hypothetical protein
MDEPLGPVNGASYSIPFRVNFFRVVERQLSGKPTTLPHDLALV